jgi:predicted metalloendopeptidase
MKRFLIALVCAVPLAVCDRSGELVELVSGVDFSGFDENVRPQDDFNAYVNGTWIRETEIPADQLRWGGSTILSQESEENQRAIIEELAARDDLSLGTDEQRVGDFFQSYLATERLEKIGGEPVRADLDRIMAAESVGDLVLLSAEQRVNGIDSPLSLEVFPDFGDSTRYMVYLFQSGLTLPDRDYYLKEDDKFETIRAALPGYAAKLYRLAGLDDADARGRAALEVERRIAEAQWPAEETRDLQKGYNLYKTEDLDSVTDRIGWQGYLESSHLPDLEELVVFQPSYVTALGELLEELPLADWKSYFALRLLHSRAPYLSSPFVQANFEFSGKLVDGLEELPPRWQRGVRSVNELMGEAVGKVYVARHFPPEAKARMEDLVENLIAAFGEAIDELEWMTTETKPRAQEKRAAFAHKIGYPDVWRDYSKLSIDDEGLIGNVNRANAFEYSRNIDKLGGPIDRTEWGMTPQTVNAYHDPTMNEIVFPAAILQPPFFNLAADDAVNYGAIGVVIGHEIGHAFDDQGRRFDGQGNMRDWWSAEDASAYQASAARLVEQYNQYEPLEGLRVNGKLTLGENIGDLTGITIAYRAYLKSLEGEEAPVLDGLTGLQRFFIGYAQIWRTKFREEFLRQRIVSDPHSPPEFRVNGPLRNSPEFFQAFGVQDGDGMWLPPEERVKIW